MAENIKIKFKNGKIRIYGDPKDFDHIYLAAAKLRIQEVDPSFKVRLMNGINRRHKKIKKLIRCIKFAVSRDTPPLAPREVIGKYDKSPKNLKQIRSAR